MVLLSATLFSTKAVLAKLVYAEVAMPVPHLLALRMAFSFPFFLAILLWQWRSHRRTKHSAGLFPPHTLLPTMLLGMLGYYVSSYLDFWGLSYISAGMERVLLFSYPTMVVLLGAWLFGKTIKRYQVMAMLVSYAGIIIAFAADMRVQGVDYAWRGGLLILGCAVTFALYVLLSGNIIPRVGVGLFTSVAMMSATAAVAIHFFFTNPNPGEILGYSVNVFVLMAVMGVFTTVLPAYLVSAGLRRIGSANVALISSVGPVITIFQARFLLGEPFGWWQALGTLLVVAGVWWVSRETVSNPDANG